MTQSPFLSWPWFWKVDLCSVFSASHNWLIRCLPASLECNARFICRALLGLFGLLWFCRSNIFWRGSGFPAVVNFETNAVWFLVEHFLEWYDQTANCDHFVSLHTNPVRNTALSERTKKSWLSWTKSGLLPFLCNTLWCFCKGAKDSWLLSANNLTKRLINLTTPGGRPPKPIGHPTPNIFFWGEKNGAGFCLGASHAEFLYQSQRMFSNSPGNFAFVNIDKMFSTKHVDVKSPQSFSEAKCHLHLFGCWQPAWCCTHFASVPRVKEMWGRYVSGAHLQDQVKSPWEKANVFVFRGFFCKKTEVKLKFLFPSITFLSRENDLFLC